MRKSAKKKQSQVQTIQRTVSSRNVTQDNDIMKKFWKGSRWFRRQCLRYFRYFLRTESRKWLFVNYISIRAFKHRPVPIDQVFCTRCILCLLQSWRFQLTALPGQTIQRVQNTGDYRSHVFMHTFTITQMPRCVRKPFLHINRITFSKKFTFDFFKIAEKFWILIFCTHNKQ